MDNALYAYSPIVERPPLPWPGDARVAFYVGLNIEHYEVDKPATSLFAGTSHLAPDPLNYGWRDYGPRVGVWRLIETLDRYGLRASVLLNSDVCTRYPQIIAAGRERDWAWLAHGKNNSIFQTGMSEAEELAYLRDVIGTIEQATGKTPKGWMGPGLTETFATPRLLAQLGVSYVLDWCADDQPFALAVPGMISVPYSVELNDIMLFTSAGLSGEAAGQAIIDQFEQLYRDAEHGAGRVMALCLHPFVAGQPFRAKYIDKALAYIANHPGVWLTTSDEIADHFATALAVAS
jgi:allantoinase